MFVLLSAPVIYLTLSPALAEFVMWAIFGIVYHVLMINLVKLCNSW
jgi:hypothetical protein